MTQAFFARLLEKNYLSAVDPRKGKSRSFLLAALEHFLAHEWRNAHTQKRGGQFTFVSTDAASSEQQYLQVPASNLSPEQAHYMAPRGKGARLILRSGSPRNFREQVLRNKIANLSQGAELGAGWGDFEIQLLSLISLGVISNHVGFNVTGQSNLVSVLEASSDFMSWTPLTTNTLGASPFPFSDPTPPNLPQRFYRARQF